MEYLLELRPEHRRPVVLSVIILATVLALLASFGLRFDFEIPVSERSHFYGGLTFAVLIQASVLWRRRLHTGWWCPVSVMDVHHMFTATVQSSIVWSILVFAVFGRSFPRSIYILDPVFLFLFLAGMRVVLRMVRESSRESRKAKQAGHKGALIYGAGWAGVGLVREIRANAKLGYQVCGFLDDDSNKRGESAVGLPILGPGSDVASIVGNLARQGTVVDEVLIALPSATGPQMRAAVASCRDAGLDCRTLPWIGDLLTNRDLVAQIRPVSVEDLLSRDPVRLDEDQISATIQDRVVIVTGAGGSIGSELTRQICSYSPSTLVLFDQAESDLFRIDLELRSKHPNLNIATEIGDIRNISRISDLLQHFPADTIFHAAAYKHVPMMESNAIEAVTTNVLGTWNLTQAAQRHGVGRFVMVSSDKAVNPTNVMGATKRASELIVASAKRSSHTNFVSVRFGNVLGSNGSVVPIFKAQIEAGGPVTVTHPEVRRYFMTIREAVQLVLQASTMGKRSEIFVLEMGEPVRVVDLARNMIRLSGLTPDVDIQIQYTGLRPGEKLFEELVLEGEDVLPTYHEKIKIFKGPSPDGDEISHWINQVKSMVELRDTAGIVAHLKKLVPEYQISPHCIHPRKVATRAGASSVARAQHAANG